MGDKRRRQPGDAAAKPGDRGTRASPHRLAAIDSEGARVSPAPPGVQRRRATREIAAEPTAALGDAVLTDELGATSGGPPPERDDAARGGSGRSRATAGSSGPPAADLPDSDAASLIKVVIEALGAALRGQYAADHRVYSDPEELAAALAQGRRVLQERRSVLVERLVRFAGVNVERVREAWDREVLALGTLALQTSDWRVGSAHLLDRWQQEVRVTDQGEVTVVWFIKLSEVALYPVTAATELEGEALPEAIAALLGLVDWTQARRLAGDLSNAQAATLQPRRLRVAELLAAVPEPHRAHYRDAFNTAVGVVATGEVRVAGALAAGGPRLKALLLEAR